MEGPFDLEWFTDELDDFVPIFCAQRASHHSSRSRGGGSRPSKAKNIDRRRHLYADLLKDDLWGPNPVYNG
jgi:hypothetical protein